MALLLNVDRVQYICSCGVWAPLCRLYFCRHCSLLRCRNCVTHEIDSIFCPNCLENMPTAEARVKKNRCGNCFDCPVCANTLTIRGLSVSTVQGGGDTDESSAEREKPGTGSSAGGPKKVYYLACNFCRWTSRDSGIADQTTPAAGWPERTNPDEKMLSAIQDQFRQMAAVEKTERERKKFTKRRTNLGMFYSDKYGLQALIARKRIGVNQPEKETVEEACVEPSEDVTTLPDEIFSVPVDLNQVTTVEQRTRQVLRQSPDTKHLFPLRKPLVVRRSLRCKECDHNLCKAEYNPSSIKFKIQLFAVLHVPEIRILHVTPLVPHEKSEVHLTVSNLSQTLTHVVLLPNVELEEKHPTLAKCDIPVAELSLPVRDETTEHSREDAADHARYNDDTSVVISRQGHKVGIKMTVTPPEFDGDILQT